MCFIVWFGFDGMFVRQIKMYGTQIVMCTLGEFCDVWTRLFCCVEEETC